MSSTNSPSLNIKSEDAPLAPVPAAAAAIGSATTSETKNNASYFSGPAIAATFASVTRAITSFFTAAAALFYGAAQYFGFFQDTNAETLSGAAASAVAAAGKDGNASHHNSPAPSRTNSYSNITDLIPPAVQTTPPAPPATPATPHTATSTSFGSVIESEEEALPRSNSQNSESSQMSNGL